MGKLVRSREEIMAQGTILIVGDNPANLSLLFKSLETAGFKVLVSADGKSVFGAISQIRPDLILLDIMMPGMDGFETCRRLKANDTTKGIPILFMTALTETVDKVKGFELGAVDYITKPFQLEEVLARIKVHLTIQNLQKQLEEQNLRLQQKVTERKQAEEALQQLKKAVETMQIGVTITDLDRRILYVNPAEAQMHGYQPEELPGKDATILGLSELRKPMTLAQIREMKTWIRESINIRKDGSAFPVRLISDVVRNPDGAPLAIVTACEDITELKRVEGKLRKAKETAEAANRAKGMFLANMSHELRTPLNAILGFSQLLSHSTNLNSEQQENLNIIRRSGEHLLTLINQVLDLSKIEADHTMLDEQNFDLHRLLGEVEDMFHLRAEKKGLQLLFERADDVPQYVRTDQVKLRQVLINLLNNAMKFTEEGGVILRIANCELRIEPTPHPSQEGKSEIRNLKFEIEDTGHGIASDELGNLFEAFIQTKRGRKLQEGTGLGLPICRKFVQLMGGDISVTSEVERGTTFKFDIQAGVIEATDIEAKRPTHRVIALEPNQPRYRILIVDDNQDNRQLPVKLLNPLGFELQEAENGQEAIEIWKEWQPHLIWMDMLMPVMDGYEATKTIRKSEIRNQKPILSEAEGSETRTVIIAVTASAFEEERAVALAAGCDDFMRKPFYEANIVELLHKHLGVRFVYEESQKSEVKDRLTVEAITALPAEWRADLKQAILDVDLDHVAMLIEQIRDQDTVLADMLKEYIRNFEYRKILQLI